MFNLCDITPQARQADNQQQQQAQPDTSQGDASEQRQGSGAAGAPDQQQHSDAAGGEQGQMGGAAVVDEAGLPALPAHLQPLQALKGAELEARERESEARFKARQRARMADMGMILDVVLASSGEKLKKEWVSCGILTQLQQALGRLPFTQEYSVVLVKVVGVLEHLPVTSDDLYTMRSAHGTFADLIRRMASSATDWEVRRRSHQLLKRYSAASCSDATLLQLYNLPGPNGKPYLLSLHLPAPKLAQLTAMLPKQPENPARRKAPRRRTPPLRGPGGPPPGHGPPGLWVPPLHGGPPGSMPPGSGYGPPPPGEPQSSPSTSHGGPGHVPAAAGGGQEGVSSMAADSSGGWPPHHHHHQQQWDGSGLPPPPWVAGGGPPPHLPPPGGFRGGRHHRHMGGPWPPGGLGGPPFGGPLPRPGSSGALAGPPGSSFGPGPSPGDWPDRPESAGPPGGEGAAAAGAQQSGPASTGRAGGGGPGERSPGPDAGYGRGGPGQPDGPWGPPDWQGRPPRGDWDAGPGGPGGRFPGRFGPPPGGPMGPFEGGHMPYSFRERERDRQRGWGRRDHDWQGENDRGRERDWGPRDDEGQQGRDADRQDSEAAPKRQRREPPDGPGGGWGPYGSPHDMPPHRMSPHGGWHGGRDEPPPGEWGWRDPSGAADGRGSRQAGWRERQAGRPAADPGVPPAAATVEELFESGLYGGAVPAADLEAWCEAVGPANAEGSLSPVVAPAGGPGSRQHAPGGPPYDAWQDQQQQWGSGGPQAPHQSLAGPPSSGRPQQTPQQQQQQYPDSWEQPGPDFEAFVGDAVKRRLGKYVQPDHPNRITKDEAQQLYK